MRFKPIILAGLAYITYNNWTRVIISGNEYRANSFSLLFYGYMAPFEATIELLTGRSISGHSLCRGITPKRDTDDGVAMKKCLHEINLRRNKLYSVMDSEVRNAFGVLNVSQCEEKKIQCVISDCLATTVDISNKLVRLLWEHLLLCPLSWWVRETAICSLS
jgi:hypothetical protein